MQQIADLGKSIQLKLKDNTDFTDVGVSTRIYVGWPKNNELKVPPFQNAIIIETGRGGRGDLGLGLIEERVDIRCYGTSDLKAHEVWRTLHMYIIKPLYDGKISFTKGQTRVYKVEAEGAPNRLIDNTQADWPFTLCTYIFTYSAQKVT